MSRIFRLVHDKRFSALRYFHHEFKQPEPDQKNSIPQKSQKMNAEKNSVPGAVRQKYKLFRDEDSTEIFDVEEERNRYQTHDDPGQDCEDEFLGLNVKTHGVHGVLDVEDLVDVLRKESANDIFVCSVPKELKYVDHMVVCSGRSYRHMLAMAEFVRRVYKKKRSKGEKIPKIEGEKSRDWMALDLGNIALHIFAPKAREEYDLESLWAIGTEYDKECNKPQDPLVELFERHSMLLADVKSSRDST